MWRADTRQRSPSAITNVRCGRRGGPGGAITDVARSPPSSSVASESLVVVVVAVAQTLPAQSCCCCSSSSRSSRRWRRGSADGAASGGIGATAVSMMAKAAVSAVRPRPQRANRSGYGQHRRRRERAPSGSREDWANAGAAVRACGRARLRRTVRTCISTTWLYISRVEMPTTHFCSRSAWHAPLRHTAEPATLYCASRASRALLHGARCVSRPRGLDPSAARAPAGRRGRPS